MPTPCGGFATSVFLLVGGTMLMLTRTLSWAVALHPSGSATVNLPGLGFHQLQPLRFVFDSRAGSQDSLIDESNSTSAFFLKLAFGRRFPRFAASFAVLLGVALFRQPAFGVHPA
jgi:hypothetical protein